MRLQNNDKIYLQIRGDRADKPPGCAAKTTFIRLSGVVSSSETWETPLPLVNLQNFNHLRIVRTCFISSDFQ